MFFPSLLPLLRGGPQVPALNHFLHDLYSSRKCWHTAFNHHPTLLYSYLFILAMNNIYQTDQLSSAVRR